MRDSITNVKSSGLGGVVKDIKRTGKYISKKRREKEHNKQQQLKETRVYLNKTQKELEKKYRKQLPKKGAKRSHAFKIKRTQPLSVKGTIHPVMKNYKVDKYGDRIY